MFWENTSRSRNASESDAAFVTGRTAEEDIVMTVIIPILIIALSSVIGYYFMDHCGRFIGEHYNAPSDTPVFLSVFQKRNKNRIYGKMSLRRHLFRKE